MVSVADAIARSKTTGDEPKFYGLPVYEDAVNIMSALNLLLPMLTSLFYGTQTGLQHVFVCARVRVCVRACMCASWFLLTNTHTTHGCTGLDAAFSPASKYMALYHHQLYVESEIYKVRVCLCSGLHGALRPPEMCKARNVRGSLRHSSHKPMPARTLAITCAHASSLSRLLARARAPSLTHTIKVLLIQRGPTHYSSSQVRTRTGEYSPQAASSSAVTGAGV